MKSLASLSLALLAGCSGLLPKATPQPSFFTIDVPLAAMAEPHSAAIELPQTPTLVINPVRAAPGFDTRHIIYIREPHTLEYFAHSEWIDVPARMLAPLLAAAAAHSGQFRAVLLTPSSAVGDLAVDPQLLRLQQDFSARPSVVRLTLHVDIIENSTRRVLASRDIDETVAAVSDDPAGGVAAANGAVQRALAAFSSVCDAVARAWKPAAQPN